MHCRRCATLEAELEFPEPSTPHVDFLSQEGFRRKISSTDLQREVDHLTMLAKLGSNTDHKFHVSLLLRSSSVTASFLFYLVRLLPHLDALVRQRATNQLRSIFRFRRASLPPHNKFLKVLQTSTDFVNKVKRWMPTFVQEFSAQFPPYHLPRAQIIEVSNQTLGQVLLNHRHHIDQWSLRHDPVCVCKHFPLLPRTGWGHVFCSAETAHSIYPTRFPSVLTSSMTDTIWPELRQFELHHVKQFARWSRQWKLPLTAQVVWQAMIRREAELLRSQPEAPRKSKPLAAQVAVILKKWITLPADHHPNELHLACPVQFHYLLIKTFVDGVIFQQMPQNVLVTSKQLVDAAKTQLGTYHHLFDLRRPLPKGYLLPKESNKWMGARPIVAYFQTNTGRLSQFVAVALTKINDRVFGRDMALPSVSFILRSLWKTMNQWPKQEALLVQQQDISGFFNAVPHKRIIDAVKYVLHRCLELEGLEGSAELSISLLTKDKLNRVFRGRLRAHTTRHHVLVLQDMVKLTEFLLQNSYLSVGRVVLRQVQGASVGSQLAPALCSTVAMLMEDQWQRVVRPMQTVEPMVLYSRYVDNRIMVLTEHQCRIHVHQAFRRLDWYRPPLLLEDVEDNKILGFECSADARQLRMLLPMSSGTIRGSDSA